MLHNFISDSSKINLYTNEAATFLRKMITIPSFSSEEKERADFIYNYLTEKGMLVERLGNNLVTSFGSDIRKHLILNSHIDTVKPCSGYTFNPHNPPFSESTIFGLGSNDAGASVAAMVTIMQILKDLKVELPFKVSLLLSAEEEISGDRGISLAEETLSSADCAIVGEPTSMKGAIAERGLLVLDCYAQGISGHAAREEGVNSIYIAMRDIELLRSLKFERVSPSMGEVKITVTQINAGSQHNVVPDLCTFTVDIRPTDAYSNQEIVDILSSMLSSKISPRNLKNRSSTTPPNHPLYNALISCGVEKYVSPTTSDWMRLSVPAIKLGPGDSSRSHRADEYVKIDEIKEGITGYLSILNTLKF